MSSHNLKIADVVRLKSDRLKSDGLQMTVEVVSGDEAGCVWVDRAQRVQREKFPSGCLVDGGDLIGKLLQDIYEGQEHA